MIFGVRSAGLAPTRRPVTAVLILIPESWGHRALLTSAGQCGPACSSGSVWEARKPK